MRVLMTNKALDARGGSESYLETVSAELRRLGHQVSFFSPECGVVAAGLRAAGFDVFERVGDLPVDFDVIHGQHVDAVGTTRTRLPAVPLVFATHSWFVSPVEDPVPELGAGALLAFNAFTQRRLAAHVASTGTPIHRLTQPIDISFADGARVPISTTALRAVAVSRRMSLLPARLAKACADLGIEFDWVGGPDRDCADPRREMFSADIVVALGRTALEAMAAGRAVLVADETTSGGWVNASSYAGLESDGFTGMGVAGPGGDLVAQLGEYSQDLGMAARALAVEHHAVQQHAVRLVEIYTSVADTRTEVTSPGTIALLASERFALEQRALRAEWAEASRQRERDVVRRELTRARTERDRALARLEVANTRRARLRGQRDRLRGQRDRLRDQRDRLRGQRDRLRRERDVARRSLARIEGLSAVRLVRRMQRAVRRARARARR